MLHPRLDAHGNEQPTGDRRRTNGRGGSRLARCESLTNADPEGSRPTPESVASLQRTKPNDGHLIFVSMADVEPEEVSWLWERRVARGKLTLLVGDPGVCKSFVSLDIASRVSTGREWPDGASGCAPGSVILLSAEDGLADTIRPRLDALGANLNQIRHLQAIKTAAAEIPFDFEESIALLEEAIRKAPPALIVVDPISAYMGNSNTHRDADVRRVLGPLVALAQKYGVAILGIMHMNKSEAAAIYRASGSVAFVALARVALVVALDKHDPERRIIASLKNNLSPLAPSLAFRVDSGDKEVGANLKWETGPVQIDVTDLLAADAPRHQKRGGIGKKEQAVRLLREMLGSGAPVPVEEIRRQADLRGISYSTLQRAYGSLGGCEAQRGDFGGKPSWSLTHAGETSTTLDDQNDQLLGREGVTHTGQDFS